MRWLDMCGAGVEMVVNGVVLHVLVDGDSDSESVSYSRKFPDWSAAPARGGGIQYLRNPLKIPTPVSNADSRCMTRGKVD